VNTLNEPISEMTRTKKIWKEHDRAASERKEIEDQAMSPLTQDVPARKVARLQAFSSLIEPPSV